MGVQSLNLKNILAENVKAGRKKLGVSQEEFADICNLHRTYIGAIERAERNITLSTLEALSQGLSIPADQLLKS
jgi:transcriptional regulator with XRE-family HTH domain